MTPARPATGFVLTIATVCLLALAIPAVAFQSPGGPGPGGGPAAADPEAASQAKPPGQDGGQQGGQPEQPSRGQRR